MQWNHGDVVVVPHRRDQRAWGNLQRNPQCFYWAMEKCIGSVRNSYGNDLLGAMKNASSFGAICRYATQYYSVRIVNHFVPAVTSVCMCKYTRYGQLITYLI